MSERIQLTDQGRDCDHEWGYLGLYSGWRHYQCPHCLSVLDASMDLAEARRLTARLQYALDGLPVPNQSSREARNDAQGYARFLMRCLQDVDDPKGNDRDPAIII